MIVRDARRGKNRGAADAERGRRSISFVTLAKAGVQGYCLNDWSPGFLLSQE